jgi:ubiquinone/menaquinone biosynthesis C-methylase UbiE
MNPKEYEVMAKIEEKFWWYEGLRGYLKSVFHIFRKEIQPCPKILDAGCGTGENLRFMRKYFGNGKFSGFDIHSTSLNYSKKKNPNIQIYQCDIRNPSLKDSQYDIITILDVLYMTGIPETLEGLKKIVLKLKPGGLLIVHNPAFKWMYSEHDQAVHTIDRFSKQDMLNLSSELQLIPLKITYRNFCLFPFIVIHRLPRIFFKKQKAKHANSDLVMPNRIMNFILINIMAFENFLSRLGVNYSFGSSVCLVARKPN